MIPHRNVSDVADTYAAKYREFIGGCTAPKDKHRKRIEGSARDLFCFGDEDDEDWEDDVMAFDSGDEETAPLTSSEMLSTTATMESTASTRTSMASKSTRTSMAAKSTRPSTTPKSVA